MTILGLILLIISGAFRMGLSVWDRGEQTREEYQRQRTVTQLVSRQIKSMVPYKIKTQKAEGDYLAFEGKANSLKFVSALSLRARGPMVLSLPFMSLKTAERREAASWPMRRGWSTRIFLKRGRKKRKGSSVLEGLSDVRFEYFREEDTEKTRTEAWFNDWNAKEEKELPRALRMKITFKNGKSEAGRDFAHPSFFHRRASV